MINKDALGELDFQLMQDKLKEVLGEEAVDVCDMLSHGMGKRQIAKQLQKPYREVKEILGRIKLFLEVYYGK